MDWHLRDQLSLDDYNELKSRPVEFGWNGLGELVFHRTYSRGGVESWNDVMERVIDGMYSAQMEHVLEVGAPWDADKVRRSALEAYDLGQRMLWTPPGRGLWAMGTEFVHERRTPEALNNCAFISSKYLLSERGDFFRWVMEMLMLGVGVGFDTLGGGAVPVTKPRQALGTQYFAVPDTREGWAKSVEALVNAYTAYNNLGSPEITFDYSRIRPEGAPIKGFGGVSAGSAVLEDLHTRIRAVLENRVEGTLTGRDIVDICNLIGRCVIAGNVRRSAEIALGNPTDEFLNLKDYTKNPDRAEIGWVSNNSVYGIPSEGNLGGYQQLAELMAVGGEPGIVWMDNARSNARMGDRNEDDRGVMGVNPCGEQFLHHREMCTLVEIHLPRVPNKLTFARTIKSAYLYGKTVTLMSKDIADPKSRDIMQTNRRIGLSLTGQAQFAGQHGRQVLQHWMDYGYQLAQYYDGLYSSWLAVPQSVRTTTVKPSGTVSLVTGVTPGVHMAPSRYHIRRVRLDESSPLIDGLMAAGIPIEQDVIAQHTVVAEFPVDAGPGPTEDESSIGEQLSFAADAQKYWSDNGVSVTVKFREDEVKDIAPALMEYQWKLKGVAFLPEGPVYRQAPYEPISKSQFDERMVGREAIHLHGDDHIEDRFCDGETCEV